MTTPRLMVIGTGDLAARVLTTVARSDTPCHLLVTGRQQGSALRLANTASLSALQLGIDRRIEAAELDVDQLESAADVVRRADPDIIFLAVSLQPWWVISQLPRPVFDRLQAAHFGPWLPLHLAPVMRAMRVIRLSGKTPIVVNAAYPDAVHPALAAVGLSPDLGIGNVANNVPGIRRAAAQILGIKTMDTDIRLVAHHYVSHRLSRGGDSGTAEMELRVLSNGRDLTDRVDVADMLTLLPVQYARVGGRSGQEMTAASAISVLRPLLDGTTALVHSPGPAGRVGGYPVLIRDRDFKLALPDGISDARAHEVNVSGQVADGIACIDQDGTITFEEGARSIMLEELGHDWGRLQLADVDACAAELRARYTEYSRRVQQNPAYQHAAPRLEY